MVSMSPNTHVPDVAPPAGADAILVVGSAHVLDLSGPLRERLAAQPLQAVALELDAERASVLEEGSTRRTRAGGANPILVRLWSLVQRRLGHELGQGAGGEMRAAARFARERNLPIFLIDDPFRYTVRRLLDSLSPGERVRLLLGALLGLFIPGRTVRRELAHYSEAPEDYLSEIRHSFPSLARVLLDERNEHMAVRLAEIRNRGFRSVAVVVGDAHVPGLAEALRRKQLPVETVGFRELHARATAP